MGDILLHLVVSRAVTLVQEGRYVLQIHHQLLVFCDAVLDRDLLPGGAVGQAHLLSRGIDLDGWIDIFFGWVVHHAEPGIRPHGVTVWSPWEVPEPLYDAHGQDVLLRALPIGGIRGKADVDGGEGAHRRADGGGGQWAAPHLDRFVLFVVRQRPPAVGRKCLGQPGPLRVIGGPGGERPASVHQHGAHQVDGACIQSGMVGSHAVLPGSLGGLRRGRQIRGQLPEIVGPGPLIGAATLKGAGTAVIRCPCN